MKDSNLSQNACVCEDEDTTTLPKEVRTTLNGCGCRCAHRAVPSFMNDVIDVRVVECHANIHVGHWHSRCALSPTYRVPLF